MNRLAPATRAILYATVAVLTLSGALWASIHYLGWPRMAAQAEALALKAFLMKVHGAAAMLMLVLVGMLLRVHVPAGWRGRANRTSGPSMLAAAGLLTATGYLLYYAGGEALREGASQVHLVVGLFLPVLLGLHVGLNAGRRLISGS